MSEETKESKLNKNIYLRYGIHMLVTLVFAAGVAWFSNEIILEKAWNDRYFLFAGVILAVIMLCSLLECKKVYTSIKTMGILMACFLVSALLLLLSDYYVNLPMWLLGGIVAAALVNRNIGMLYLYYFVYHAIYLQGSWMNGLVFHFVVATLIAFFIPKMKTFLGMFYMMAFSASIIIAGSIMHNKMSIDETMMLDTFYILCTYLVCILVTMLLVKWAGNTEQPVVKPEAEEPNDYAYLDLLAKETAEQDAAIAEIKESIAAEKAMAVTETMPETVEINTDIKLVETAIETFEEAKEVVEEVIEEVIEETTEQISEVEPNVEVEETPVLIDYAPYCDEKSELLLELRSKNKSVYAQAVLVGKLAFETAKSIGLNAELTKAAGLYKRIGKIKEENNEYTSTEIAKEYNFPQPLIYLLDQLNHNIIEQKEAALLLITDGVISYYSIVRHVQKTDIPVEKIVDTIVSKKIFQGEFNESGLSMQECFLLREKLIDLLKTQDSKRASK